MCLKTRNGDTFSLTQNALCGFMKPFIQVNGALVRDDGQKTHHPNKTPNTKPPTNPTPTTK